MVTRQTRRGVSKAREERLEKAQERRFVKSLEEARDTLDEVIERAVMGDNRTFDSLEQFSGEMDAVYSQARRLESE